MPKFTSAKFNKLKKNPKLFFRDFYVKNFYGKSIDLVNKIPNDGIRTYSTTLVQDKFKKIEQKSSGYRYYLENYESTEIEENHILLDSFWGRKIGCHPYAIYKTLKQHPIYKNYKYTWVKEHNVEIPRDVEKDLNVKFVEYSSIEYADALLKARILICNSNLAPYFSPKETQCFITTWHGIPLKTLGYRTKDTIESVYNTQRNFNISTIIPSSSKFYTENVIEAYGASLTDNKIEYIGSPRIDLLLNTDPKKIKELLNINSDKKIVLYAPTWRGIIGSVNDDIQDQIKLIEKIYDELSNTHEIFVSLHHLTEKALGDKYKSLNINKVPKNIDINEFMSACDLLISDYSSIFIDFLILDRPVILYTPDLESYKEDRGLILNIEDLPVNSSHNLEEFSNCLNNLTKPSQSNKYIKFLDEFLPYEDGHASQRLITILENKRETKSKLKNKIIITAGGLKTNGITNSLQNFIKNIDKEKNEIYLLINCKLVENDLEKLHNFNKLKDYCNIILTIAPKNFSLAEQKAFNKFHSKIDLFNQQDEHLLSLAFKREYHRLFGHIHFTHAIDYTGYSTYWSLLISNSIADKKYIFLHSDMLKEKDNSKRNHKHLNSIFYLYNKFDKLISVSKAINETNKYNLQTQLKLGEEKFCYIPNQLQIERIKTLAETPLALISPKLALIKQEKDVVKFICVGRISPEKGQLSLLYAFKIIINKNINAILTFVGDGPLMLTLKKLVVELDIKDRVIFLGQQSNPFALIKNSDCLVQFSEYEGQGLAVLEAMTLGIPCIGSDCPAIREIIEDHGGIIAKQNINNLADKLEFFCKNSNIENIFDPIKYNAESTVLISELLN